MSFNAQPKPGWKVWVQLAYNIMKKGPVNTEHVIFAQHLMLSYFIFTLIYRGRYYNHHFTNWDGNT